MCSASRSTRRALRRIALVLKASGMGIRGTLINNNFNNGRSVAIRRLNTLLACMAGGPVGVGLSETRSLLIRPGHRPFCVSVAVKYSRGKIVRNMGTVIGSSANTFTSLNNPILRHTYARTTKPCRCRGFRVRKATCCAGGPPTKTFHKFNIARAYFTARALLGVVTSGINVAP